MSLRRRALTAWLGLVVWLVCGGVPAFAAETAAAPRLLWITSDITTAARTAALQRLAEGAGWSFTHIDYPLGGPGELPPAQAAPLQQALAAAAMVWVDVPHASVEARLRKLVGPRLDAWATGKPQRLVWVPAGEPGAGDAAAWNAQPAAARMAGYLQAGGERNLGHALQLARSLVAQQAAPALPPPRPGPRAACTTPMRPACCPMPPRSTPGVPSEPTAPAGQLAPPWPCWCTATIS
ncbi:hypothetical protein [Paenacidovorax monticola]|uniref:hypothetical protein n=1 Tax=Paenacidovorax monticola TaxID=1926868 RepID=UPI001FE31658|nr:hypothetical protein [Paenacidovorax monticola]